eukprot:1069486-Pyramimonas_sp.AAC.1
MGSLPALIAPPPGPQHLGGHRSGTLRGQLLAGGGVRAVYAGDVPVAVQTPELLTENLFASVHVFSAPWICFASRQGKGQASETCATDESVGLSCRRVPFLPIVIAALRAGDAKDM